MDKKTKKQIQRLRQAHDTIKRCRYLESSFSGGHIVEKISVHERGSDHLIVTDFIEIVCYEGAGEYYDEKIFDIGIYMHKWLSRHKRSDRENILSWLPRNSAANRARIKRIEGRCIFVNCDYNEHRILDPDLRPPSTGSKCHVFTDKPFEGSKYVKDIAGENTPIYIYYRDIDAIGGRLILLHEVMHALLYELTVTSCEAFDELKLNYQKIVKSNRRNCRSGEIPFIVNENKIPRPIARSLVLNAYLKLARAERAAWAGALWILRQARRHGTELEPELKSYADLEKFIHGHRQKSLAGHETDFVKRQAGPDKATGLITKKIYKYYPGD